MSGLLNHDPSDIVRWLLIGIGQGTDPTASGAWPVCVEEADLPDSLIVVSDTQGRMDGRIMHTGEQDSHPGVQVKVRAATRRLARAKANQVAIALDEGVLRNAVTIGANTYCVQSVSRTGDILSIGKEVGSGSKRSLYTINCVISVTQVA